MIIIKRPEPTEPVPTERLNKRITFYTTESHDARLRAEAEATNTSLSALCRRKTGD